ncbi:cathelicidin-related peptide Pt_CRAMP2-like [Choloepus didactylus]|uniref:cathelicidin-related peptide Pt_CRAMP2-like n=1 Tax=Choloepus didactylus TaxID=27675 RepID=UPI0018A11C26|nr:cathelicidin-related peptide Pt_CRAMP2-like [Choloepus didactylus]
MRSIGVAVLLLLGLKWAEPASFTKDTSLSQAEALDVAINVYNNQKEEDHAFRILDALPQADWDPTLSKPQSLFFTIKETECKIVENLKLDQCPFKDNGQVKNCRVLFKVGEKGLSMENSCEPLSSTGPVRARRGLRKVFRKIKDKLKKILPKKPIMISWSKKF